MRTDRHSLVTGRMAAVAFLLAVVAAPSVAQAPQDTATLTRARFALFDLRYGVADSLARLLHARPDRVATPTRITALQIAAAARYPEEPFAQYPESAMVAMRELKRLGASTPLPRDITWPGLDSLFKVAMSVAATERQVGGAVAGAQPAGPPRGVPARPNPGMVFAWLSRSAPAPVTIEHEVTQDGRRFTLHEERTALRFERCMMSYRYRREESRGDAGGGAARSARDTMLVYSLARLDPARVQVDTASLSWTPPGAPPGAPKKQVVRTYLRFYRRGAPPMPLRAADTPAQGTLWFDAPLPAVKRVRNALELVSKGCAARAR